MRSATHRCMFSVMTLKQLSSRKAALYRHLGPDDPRTLEAAGALRTALLRAAIEKAMASKPPLSRDERRELVALLAGERA